MSRRALLGAGGGVALAGVTGALVEYDVLPGRTRAHELLGLNGPDGAVPDAKPGPVGHGTLATELVAVDPAWVIAYPPGAEPGDPLPVVVVLHMAGSSAAEVMVSLGLPQFLAASGQRMALAAVDGGSHSYWHPRADGQDSGGMVLEDFLPLLAAQGFQADRPAFLGWSMGGLGALCLAVRRAAAAGTNGPLLAVSPALWPDYDQTAPGAFDDAADFDEVMALVRGDVAGPTRVDCGTGDPFYRHVVDFTSGRDLETHFEAGDHTGGYWTRVLPEQLAWLGGQLAGTAQ